MCPQIKCVRKWSRISSEILLSNFIVTIWLWDGMGVTMAHYCIQHVQRIVPWPPTFMRSSKALLSSRVIPAKNPYHGCKYSTGTSRTINMAWIQLLLPVQGMHPDLQYSIGLYCNTIFTIFDSTATCRIKSWQEVNYDIQVDTVFTLHPQEPGENIRLCCIQRI